MSIYNHFTDNRIYDESAKPFAHVNTVRGEDIFNSRCRTIVIPTNTLGIMGAGLAKQCRQTYPRVYKEYLTRCQLNMHSPSEPVIKYGGWATHNVICLATKKDWRNKSRIEYIEVGLKWLSENASGSFMLKSIAIPPLGCGLGGLDWKTQVRPLYIKYLPLIKLPITLYLPKNW